MDENYFMFFKSANYYFVVLFILIIHLCASASEAVSLFSGFAISFLIRSLASLEMISHSSPSKV